jgi:hypothetical protein
LVAKPMRMAGLFSFLAGAVVAGLADFLADGPTPSWLVWVGSFLGRHFPSRSLSSRLSPRGLLLLGPRGPFLWELGRRLLAAFFTSVTKKTHGAIVDRRIADARLLICTRWLAAVGCTRQGTRLPGLRPPGTSSGGQGAIGSLTTTLPGAARLAQLCKPSAVGFGD